jgi:hypothetical protein
MDPKLSVEKTKAMQTEKSPTKLLGRIIDDKLLIIKYRSFIWSLLKSSKQLMY